MIHGSVGVTLGVFPLALETDGDGVTRGIGGLWDSETDGVGIAGPMIHGLADMADFMIHGLVEDGHLRTTVDGVGETLTTVDITMDSTMDYTTIMITALLEEIMSEVAEAPQEEGSFRIAQGPHHQEVVLMV